MSRLLFFALAFLWAGLAQPAAAQSGTAAGLPPRPTPFQFVNDQAKLMAPADAKKLESGLRRYADNTGTQVVVVTVHSLGGRTVADYARGLGESWGVGQRDKNNGVVVLVSQQERQVSIQPGSGLKNSITPAVTSQIIGQMTPSFKQGNYFAGLRTGLNTLMATANPDSAPKNDQEGATASSYSTAPGNAGGPGLQTDPAGVAQEPVANTPNDPLLTPPSSEPSSGFGIGTILLGALGVGGLLWILMRMFRRKSAPAATAAPGQPTQGSPNFLPNQQNAPDFLPNRNPGNGPNNGPGNGQRGGNNYNATPNQGGGIMGGGGSGMGGMLATGAAAAAGAYLGNRMASGHEAQGHGLTGDNSGARGFDPNTASGAAGAGAMGTGAASDFFSSRDGGAGNAAPDYFSDDLTNNESTDYFSADDNTYDDPSSGDMGGGGFDSGDDNSGSW
ncbi:TPM domain-containing protein [Hymenobacter arizonensis]|uniref:TLP18.3, Psb32 and MOLO-1 founding protein of phosphatase n=1 Tax=Hymenobacter arizonensis TaxID=1227077 RepID=A0A1I5XVA5_HYMAR|nr:TPM domain-containing protein [Hymenobacter arizonensis]SFQ35889.1 TLP18.3, Psb32 and MOLO-1 founding protein of phosphatase [Hymenobacter arizonensis]